MPLESMLLKLVEGRAEIGPPATFQGIEDGFDVLWVLKGPLDLGITVDDQGGAVEIVDNHLDL